MADFNRIYFGDLNESAQKDIKKDFEFSEKEGNNEYAVAARFDEEANVLCPHLAGSIDNLMKIIPILADMGYDDLALTYDDCGIWKLRWHNPEYDNMEWILVYR